MKNLQIQMSKCLLILSEQELLECLTLKPELYKIGIGRGKGKLRAESERNRVLKNNARGFDRWKLYELLKYSDKKVDNDLIRIIEGMDATELREGLIEWLLTRNRIVYEQEDEKIVT